MRFFRLPAAALLLALAVAGVMERPPAYGVVEIEGLPARPASFPLLVGTTEPDASRGRTGRV
ncbi:MAG: hypothetical protein HY319_15520 [Armatimonadetes bacterium]|nr:hypothetical protein [Armatimonadota bacterium]